VVWTPPPTVAMDIMALGGGPTTTVYPKLATGDPPSIAQNVAQHMHTAAQFLEMIDLLSGATSQLSNAWSGSASEAAIQKIASTMSAFNEIIEVIQVAAQLKLISGAVVAWAQAAYNTTGLTVEPQVKLYMNNYWTMEAASALATAGTATLSSYVGICEGVLHGLGSGKLLPQLQALMMIIEEIEQLSKGGGSGGSSGASKAAALAVSAGSAYMASRAASSTPTYAGLPGSPAASASASGGTVA
jgi:uncharacterized protein YukE